MNEIGVTPNDRKVTDIAREKSEKTNSPCSCIRITKWRNSNR